MKLRVLLFSVAFVASSLLAETPAVGEKIPSPEQTRTAITALLREFLAGVDHPATHARFWADDLVYTSGKGVVRTKAQILASVAGEQSSSGPKATYEAQDVQVRPYGNFAALNFRLVVHDANGATWYSRNSGAFLWRNGQWQVVTWQATREASETER